MKFLDRFRKKPTRPDIAATAPEQREGQVEPAKLLQLIMFCFDINELRDLCFELAVDYDALPGDGKLDKARELIAFFQRPERSIDELIQACVRLQPKAPWTSRTTTEYSPYGGVSLVELRQKLAVHFTEDELHAVCTKFGVSYRYLPDTRSAARELIAYLVRRERLHELAEECSKRRPDVPW